jgi:hypothetical protein
VEIDFKLTIKNLHVSMLTKAVPKSFRCCWRHTSLTGHSKPKEEVLLSYERKEDMPPLAKSIRKA